MIALQNAIPPLNLGLFGIGVDTKSYQFAGLENRKADVWHLELKSIDCIIVGG